MKEGDWQPVVRWNGRMWAWLHDVSVRFLGWDNPLRGWFYKREAHYWDTHDITTGERI
jgi:hypothetical protein